MGEGAAEGEGTWCSISSVFMGGVGEAGTRIMGDVRMVSIALLLKQEHLNEELKVTRYSFRSRSVGSILDLRDATSVVHK